MFILFFSISPSNIPPSAEKIPEGLASYANQNGALVEFEILQPTKPIPQNLVIDLCSGSVGITITSASGQSNTNQQIWNMGTCDYATGRALICVNINEFTAEENHTVVFNISFHLNGDVNRCYLQLEANNITVSDKCEQPLLLLVLCQTWSIHETM